MENDSLEDGGRNKEVSNAEINGESRGVPVGR